MHFKFSEKQKKIICLLLVSKQNGHVHTDMAYHNFLTCLNKFYGVKKASMLEVIYIASQMTKDSHHVLPTLPILFNLLIKSWNTIFFAHDRQDNI
jgi:hypothetical protein